MKDKVLNFIDEKVKELRGKQDNGLPTSYHEGMLDGLLMVAHFVEGEQ